MALHTIYTYDEYGKYTGYRQLDTSAAHPKRFTLIEPTIEAGKVPVFNFTKWVNVDASRFEPTLDKLKADKIAELRAYFNSRIEMVKSDNAPYEIDTWTTQCTEWTAWIQNNSTPTPYIDALATARNILKVDLMAKIGYKVVAIATVQGTQHGIEDAIKAASTKEELDAIRWS